MYRITLGREMRLSLTVMLTIATDPYTSSTSEYICPEGKRGVRERRGDPSREGEQKQIHYFLLNEFHKGEL